MHLTSYHQINFVVYNLMVLKNMIRRSNGSQICTKHCWAAPLKVQALKELKPKACFSTEFFISYTETLLYTRWTQNRKSALANKKYKLNMASINELGMGEDAQVPCTSRGKHFSLFSREVLKYSPCENPKNREIFEK